MTKPTIVQTPPAILRREAVAWWNRINSLLVGKRAEHAIDA